MVKHIKARDLSSDRSMRWVVKGLGGAGAGAILGGLYAAVWGARPVLGVAVIVAGCLCLAAAIVLAGRYPAWPGISMDVRQSQWALNLGLTPLAFVVISPIAGEALWRVADGQPLEGRWALLIFAVWVLMFAAQLSWGLPKGGLGDELLRSYVASGMAWGFVAALMGFVILALLVLVSAQVVVSAVPVVLALVLWVVGLRVWWLVRGADNV